MTPKGVNIMEDDGSSDDEYEDEYDEDGEEGGGSKGRLVKILVSSLIVVAVVGGASWGGYQYWWLPRQEKARKKAEAQKRLEKLRQARLAQAKAEEKRRELERKLLQRLQKGKGPPKAAVARKAKPAPKRGKTPPAPPVAKAVPKSGKGGAAKRAAKGPIGSVISPEEIRRAAPPAARKTPKAAPPPKVKFKQAREIPAASAPQKAPAPSKAKAARKAPPPKPPARPKAAPKKSAPKPAPRKRPRKIARKPSRTPGVLYSVQVASCRTDRCVRVFMKRLRAKGFSPHVTGGRRSAPVRRNEVLIGTFSSKGEADTLVAQARKKGIRATAYRSGKRWKVSAGIFADLENAAQRLDEVADKGFRGELASRLVPGRRRFRTIRAGKFSSRGQANRLRLRIVKAGFSGAIVVRQRGK